MAELTGQLCVSFRLSDSECLPGDLSVVILADRSSAQIHHGTEEETPLPRCFPSPTKENECAHCALQQRHQQVTQLRFQDIVEELLGRRLHRIRTACIHGSFAFVNRSFPDH